jgi:flavin reductase (DIM6/NTAB) family NADH-FMN oxidoreductase RutF
MRRPALAPGESSERHSRPTALVESAVRSSVEAHEFRAAMRRVPAAVTVVTTMVGGVRHGFTATAVASVSADPAQLLVCVNRGTRSAAAISRAGRFGVSYLGAEQIAVAEAFATPADDPEDRFRRVPVRSGSADVPLLRDALVAFACTVVSEIHSGTHVVFIGQVTQVAGQDIVPLLYQDGSFVQTSQEGIDR